MDIGRRFGANLNSVRRAAGFSQEGLAVKAGLHRTEIGLLEHGRRLPRIDTVAKLARALGVGPGELLLGVDSRQQPHRAHQIEKQGPSQQIKSPNQGSPKPTK